MPQPHTAGTAAIRARKGTATITERVTISSELLCLPMALAGSPACGSARGGAVGRVRAGADKETPERYLARRGVEDRPAQGLCPRNLRDRRDSGDRGADPPATVPDGCLGCSPRRAALGSPRAPFARCPRGAGGPRRGWG